MGRPVADRPDAAPAPSGVSRSSPALQGSGGPAGAAAWPCTGSRCGTTPRSSCSARTSARSSRWTRSRSGRAAYRCLEDVRRAAHRPIPERLSAARAAGPRPLIACGERGRGRPRSDGQGQRPGALLHRRHLQPPGRRRIRLRLVPPPDPSITGRTPNGVESRTSPAPRGAGLPPRSSAACRRRPTGKALISERNRLTPPITVIGSAWEAES